jgi:3-oxoacyl-[acyl-carrier-protein] synthase II
MSLHRVVITGIGLLTPVGNTKEENWASLVNGRSGLSMYDHPGADECPSKVVGLVKNEQSRLDVVCSAKDQRKTDRFIHLALIAADEAMRDAGFSLSFPVSRERFGTYLGIGIGGLPTIVDASKAYEHGGIRKVSPFMIPKVISNEAPSWLSMKWDLQGPSLAMTNACSSSGDAVGMAYRAIRHGYADYMLTGGTESCVTPITLAAFGNMRALSSWQGDPAAASRPFDKQRSGFVLAEGSGILILERKDLAEKRGAHMYAEIVGYGATADAYHITAMHPDGRGATRALNLALEQAEIRPEKIGYVNAHGTATPMNDAIETLVLKKVFGSHAQPKQDNHLLVSSTKSMTGHMLGAAGGAEISFTALALDNQTLPPTINRQTPDEQCDLDYLVDGARTTDCEYAISNSFGFGGGNAVIVLKRYS